MRDPDQRRTGLGADAQDPLLPGEPVAFRSTPVPSYVRSAASVEEFVPWLYLKDVSSGEMAETLQILPGPEAAGVIGLVRFSFDRAVERGDGAVAAVGVD